jgi:hypothetical protein
MAVLGWIALLVVQQPGTGTVAGRIQDPEGTVVPGVMIILEHEGTTRKTTSDARGTYSIADVPAGTYRIDVQLPGFRPFSQANVIVNAGSTITINARLRLNNGRSTFPPDGMDRTDPALAQPVYAAVLAAIYRNAPSEMLVARTSLSLVPAVLSQYDWTGSFSLVAELRSRLEQAADRAPVFLRAEEFPSGVKLVADGEGSRRTSFTPVFFTADGSRAVVYYEHYCGMLCGQGVMVWLTRTTTRVWQISGSKLFWES